MENKKINFFKERVCEDSASAELSVTDIASAMSEITYLLEEMQNTLQYQQSAFKPSNGRDQDDDYALDSGPAETASGENMPATVDELKDILSNLIFLNLI